MLRFQYVSADRFDRKANWFNALRLIAAILVLIAHAFPIATGLTWNKDPIRLMTGFTDMGGLGVIIFFIISGFLVAKSFERSSLAYYCASRILRIYPAFIVVVIISTFVIGPLVTNQHGYFSHDQTWNYLKTLLFFRMEYHLPGVFFNNPLATEINGSLWTLQYEVCCYVLLPLVLFISIKKRYFLTLFFIISFVIKILFPDQVENLVLPFLGVDFRNFYDFLLYFLAGSIIYNYYDKIPLNITISLILVIVCFIIPPAYGKVFSFVAIPYLVIVLAFLPAGYGATRMADVSYGMYLYGFPVQQIIKHVLPTVSALNLLLLCIPATFIFAIASRKVIEKPALALKSHWLKR